MSFSVLKKTGVFCIYCAITVLFIFAVIITLARSVNPIAQGLSYEFTDALETALSIPVKLETFEISWSDTNPVIWFNHVELGEKDSKLNARRVVATVNLKSTLLQQKIIFKKITLEGVLLRIEYNSELPKQRKIKAPSANALASKNDLNATQALIAWLSSIDELQLKNSTIELLHNGKESVFTGINLDIANHEENHKLKLQILLPKEIGNKIIIVLDANGATHLSKQWDGKIYIEAENLNLKWLSEEFKEIPGRFLSGKSSFKVWSHWQKGNLKRVHVSSLNKAFRLKLNKEEFKADQLNAEFWLSHRNNEWLLKSNNIYYQQDKTTWDSGNVFVRYDESTQSPTLDGYIEHLDAGLIRKKIRNTAFDNQSIPLIQGELNNVYFYYNKKNTVPNYGFSTEIKQLDITSGHNNPGISNFSGKLIIKNKQGLLQSTIKNGSFNSNGLFRKPIKIEVMKGTIQFDIDKNWSVRSPSIYIKTPELTVHTQIKITKRKNQEADVNINAKVVDVKSENVKKYLPIPIMSTDLINWLDKSIKKGKVNEVYFLMRGNMKDFPFENNKGVFDIGFDTKKLTLDYEDNWPLLKNINADVRFYANKMTIKGKYAQLNNVVFKDLNVSINNLYKAKLKIKGMGKGAFKNYKNFINDSPLKSKLGLFVNQFDFYGKANLKLSALFDIDGNDSPKINGKLMLKKARLDSKKFKLQLKNIVGDVLFTENEISAKKLKLTLFDENWELKASTFKNSKNVALSTRVKLTGLLDPKKIVNDYFDYSELKTIGKSVWKVNINVPISDELPPPIIALNFQTDLKGVGIDYPHPLNKVSQKKKNININLRLPNIDNEAYINADVDNLLKIKQRWKAEDTWRLTRSYTLLSNSKKTTKPIRFSTAIHQLKVDANGINVDEWLALTAKNKTETTASSVFGWFDKVDASLKKSVFNTQSVAFFQASIKEKQNAYHYALSSDFITGEIIQPKDSSDKLDINLRLLKADYLKTDEPTSDWLISDIPSLNLKIKKLIMAGITLENIELTTLKENKRIKIEKLGFDNPHMSFSSHGRWWGADNGDTQTNLQFLIKTDNLGKALSRFKYGDTFDSGEGAFTGDFTWPGSLMNATLAGLNGSFSLNLKDGRMKDIEPGVGRIFGLFSLQALPKRLLLDFSDVVGSGLEYEKINGNFKITNGDAFTHDLEMNSSIGDVFVTGRTGLATKDYDQKIKFIPSVFTNLPVVGALAVNPQLGLTILVIETFLKSIGADISKASAINYKLNGTWDNPSMKLDVLTLN